MLRFDQVDIKALVRAAFTAAVQKNHALSESAYARQTDNVKVEMKNSAQFTAKVNSSRYYIEADVTIVDADGITVWTMTHITAFHRPDRYEYNYPHSSDSNVVALDPFMMELCS